MEDIVRYNIGYCERGLYANYIIIPSYNEHNQLNFFAARSFTDADFKYRLPSWSKDIVGFENQINWSLPVILVEGPFDAIKVSMNAILLFGTQVLPELHEKLITKAQEIYIGLDPDAKQTALKLSEHFMNNGKIVHMIDLPKDTDFGKLTPTSAQQYINNSGSSFTFNTLIRERISLI
jgi:DNA primase